MRHNDFVKRALWLKERGNPTPWNRVQDFLSQLVFEEEHTFESNQMTYQWCFFKSTLFQDFIQEVDLNFIYIVSPDHGIEVIGHIIFDRENLIGEPEDPRMTYIWILNENFPGLEEIEHHPAQLGLPISPRSSRAKFNYTLKQIFNHLHDKSVEVIEYVEYKKYQVDEIRWRVQGRHRTDS